MFPDGTHIEGLFQNNIYKGPEKPETFNHNALAAT